MTHEAVGQCSLPRRRFSVWRARVVAILAVAIVTADAVHAEVHVNGDASALQVVATQSNVAETLSALETTFRLQVNTPIVLDRAIGGTLAGSLAQVLSRLLEGYNFFIRYHATEIEVTVIGPRGERAVAVTQRRPPPNLAMSIAEAVRLNRH